MPSGSKFEIASCPLVKKGDRIDKLILNGLFCCVQDQKAFLMQTATLRFAYKIPQKEKKKRVKFPGAISPAPKKGNCLVSCFLRFHTFLFRQKRATSFSRFQVSKLHRMLLLQLGSFNTCQKRKKRGLPGTISPKRRKRICYLKGSAEVNRMNPA